MTFDDFRATLNDSTPPEGASTALKAMWFDANDNWEEAHTLSQSLPDSEGAWVHAYLHRREGDLANAGYWYRRAGKPVAGGTLEDEWSTIVADLLAD